MNSYRPPMLGFEDMEAEGQELAPIAIQWKDGTPVGILGAGPQDWIPQQEVAEEVERARREEAISLATNVYLLDRYRQRSRKDDYRETL
jgi:hypothetical protein